MCITASTLHTCSQLFSSNILLPCSPYVLSAEQIADCLLARQQCSCKRSKTLLDFDIYTPQWWLSQTKTCYRQGPEKAPQVYDNLAAILREPC